MNWAEVLVIIGANLGLMIPMFLWLRSEANADRRDIAKMCMDMHNDVMQQMNEFRNDMRDFHGRLCTIEEKNKRT